MGYFSADSVVVESAVVCFERIVFVGVSRPRRGEWGFERERKKKEKKDCTRILV